MLSSLVLLIPSIITSLILGSRKFCVQDLASSLYFLVSDSWSVKVPMLIPFVGHICGDVIYIIQAMNIEWNPYYLLISDLITGISGGFIAVIGKT